MPTRGFYWLIPPTPTRGGLAGMPRPYSRELLMLPELGIGLLISLLNYTILDGDTPLALRAIHLPMRNDGTPSQNEFPRIAAACAIMHHWRLRLNPSNSVGVHCLLGQARTGMMLCCYRGYLRVHHPQDPDALAPEETALEVGRLLQDIYEERGLGPNDSQVRFARWFTSWLETRSRTDFDAQTVEELNWRRKTGLPTSDMTARTLWQCANPDCRSRASHQEGLAEPLWCLSCGQASGRQTLGDPE